MHGTPQNLQCITKNTERSAVSNWVTENPLKLPYSHNAFAPNA